MEMTRIEKFLVNRESKGLRNVARVERLLRGMNLASIRDVLEIGCGIGTVSASLASDYGWNVIGTDYDAGQIDEAKNRYPESGGLEYRREDATRLSFTDGSFDFVIAQMVFHHIQQWPAAVRELARVLRPNGSAIWFDHVVWDGMMQGPGSVLRHAGLYGRKEAEQAFCAAGFEPIVSYRTGLPLFSFDEILYRKKR